VHENLYTTTQICCGWLVSIAIRSLRGTFRFRFESGVLYSTVLPGSGNIIGGKAVLIRNFVQDIEQAYIMDVGIKAALGYNPRSTMEWKGNRPSTRMGAVAMLRENFIKARKMQALVQKEKKIIDEVEPLTEVLMDILSGRFKIMFHVHKEDDIMVLIQLVKEFGIKAIANHCCDVHREGVFAALKASSVPIIYGPLDAFPYKVELKNESWRNAENLLSYGRLKVDSIDLSHVYVASKASKMLTIISFILISYVPFFTNLL
jgi:imidazolonepropionase-like amidohydrolase